ncbi:hypothetical protein PENPOL_c029G03298 [Penicillium polonicum]|uniref:Uncharacterized protein n=1 Tax=Penicillium polonicum TaxID=60169 RepID=A0A1V6N5W3_PENPO|nr:hypothetical protein PENPOL_c029G03298 [Penicillium polonicum]
MTLGPPRHWGAAYG